MRQLTLILTLVCSCIESSDPTLVPVKVAGAGSAQHKANDAGADRDSEDAATAELDGGAESQPDAGSALSFEAEITGLAEPVSAVILPGPPARIRVLDYPTQARAAARYGLLPSGYEGAFSAKFCEQVAARVKTAAMNNNAGQYARRQLRDGGAVSLRIAVSPLLGAAFEQALRGAARNAGIQYNPSSLANPLQLEAAALKLQLTSDALTQTLGGTDAMLREQNAYLTQQLRALNISGEFNAAFSAKDLLCDLAQGRATLSFELRGKAAQDVYVGTTTVSGLVPY